MIEFYKAFFGKKIRILSANGREFIGVVTDYFYPEDNDNQMDSMVIETLSHEYIEFSKSDIIDVTIME